MSVGSAHSIRRGLAGSRLLLLAALVACGALAPGAAAAYVLRMSTAELAERAELIVSGVVERLEAGPVHRRAVIAIDKVLKGTHPARRLAVRYSPGIEDAADFKPKERVTLYLVRIDAQTWQTVGGFQGKVTR